MNPSSYTVRVERRVLKRLKRIDAQMRVRILAAIKGLESDPFPSRSNKLAEKQNTWRLRVGDYRVIYTVENKQLTILVINVDHRRQVYRDLPKKVWLPRRRTPLQS